VLGRREFVMSVLGAGAAGAVALRSERLGLHGPSINPSSYGARGDGSSNDLDALNRAFAEAVRTGRPIDGNGAVFAVAGTLRITNAKAPRILSMRLRQLQPANGVATLHLEKCEAIEIDRLQIDLGRSRRIGDMNSTFGLWIEGGSNHRIRNVEAFGDGKNSLISIWATSGSSYDNLLVRDAEFDDASASDDVMQGVWLYGNWDCILHNPVVSNLTGNASYVGRPFANLRTRGIALSKNTRVSIIEPKVDNVDQGIDVTGSDGNVQCVISGGHSSDCGSVGVKFANSAVECRAVGHVAERCGMYGFMASGPAEADLRLKTQDCTFVDCTSLDAGYNRISFPAPSGFIIRRGDYDLDFPKRIRFVRCRAIDRQVAKTMRYGFYSEVPPSARPEDANELVGCTSEGHARAAKSGPWR
jgi:hypothetical protein